MLTTIPFDEFISVNDGTIDEASEQFNINKFKKLALISMKPYLTKVCHIPVKGRGSSREAYFLNKANFAKVKGPACLKVVRTDGLHGIEAGIAQNREETTILKKFQGKHDCFPYLYDYDKNNYFMIVELGTPMSKAPNSFVRKLFEPMKDIIEDFLDENDYPVSKGDFWNNSRKGKFMRLLQNLQKKDNFTEFIVTISEMMTMKHKAGIYSNKEALWMEEFLHTIEDSDDPIAYSIYETLNFAMEKDAKKLIWYDFITPENWAFVNRNGYFMLIPIDWGFSKKVQYKYY